MLLMNSAVLPAGGYGTYQYAPATWSELRAALAAAHISDQEVWLWACQCGRPHVVSRIGYQETADLIKRETGADVPLSRETSSLRPGDVAFVVRLSRRVDPATKGATGASLDDWEVGRLVRLS